MWGFRFVNDGEEFLVGSTSGSVYRFDVVSGKVLMTYQSGPGKTYRITLHPDGKHFVSTGGQTCALWELASGKLIRKFLGHKDRVYTAAITKDGKRLLTGSKDKTFRIYDLESGFCLKTLKGDPAFDWIYYSEGDRLNVIDRFDPNQSTSIDEGLDWRCKVFQNGHSLLLVSRDELIVLEAKSLKEIFRLDDSKFDQFALSRDGSRLVTKPGSKTGIYDKLTIWNTLSGEQTHQFSFERRDNLECLAFRTNGKSIIGKSSNRTDFHLFSLDEEKLLFSFSLKTDLDFEEIPPWNPENYLLILDGSRVYGQIGESIESLQARNTHDPDEVGRLIRDLAHEETDQRIAATNALIHAGPSMLTGPSRSIEFR